MKLTLTTDEGVVIDEWSVDYRSQGNEDSFDMSKGMARMWVQNEIQDAIEHEATLVHGECDHFSQDVDGGHA